MGEKWKKNMGEKKTGVILSTKMTITQKIKSYGHFCYGGEGWEGGVLHSFYSASGFYKFICLRPPHFLSASYAPGNT